MLLAQNQTWLIYHQSYKDFLQSVNLPIVSFDQAPVYNRVAAVQDSTHRNNAPEVVGILGRKQSLDL